MQNPDSPSPDISSPDYAGLRKVEITILVALVALLTVSRFYDLDMVVKVCGGTSLVLWLWSVGYLHFLLYAIPLLALRIVGASDWFAESLIGICVIVCVEFGATKWQRWGRFSPMLRVLLVVVGWWWLSSLWMERQLPEPGKMRGNWNQDTNRTTYAALTLSGGGLRASTFHAGVMQEMTRRGLAPRFISSVSGGSITASHYAVRGQPSEFLQHVQENHLLVKKWIFRLESFIHLIGGKGRLDAQAELLDRLFLGRTRMEDVGDDPYLLICTTDIGRGRLVGWTPEGYVTLEVTRNATYRPTWRDLSANRLYRRRLLSEFVAASGAFPGAFNTLNVAGFDDKENAERFERNIDGETAQFLLADGGLVDNYGLALLLEAIDFASNDRGSGWKGLRKAVKSCTVVVESDATQVLEAQMTDDPIKSFVRSLDIIYSTSQSFSHGKMKEALEERVRASSKIQSFHTVSPLLLYASTPVYTPRELRDVYDKIMKNENVHAGALRDRIRETPNHERLRADNNLGFLLTVLQERAIELRIRRAITSVDFDAAKELVELSEQAARGLDKQRFKADQDVYKELEGSYTVAQIPGFRSGALSYVYDDLLACAEAFWNTTTLDDQISGEKAERIYRLGRYLAAIQLANFPVIPVD